MKHRSIALVRRASGRDLAVLLIGLLLVTTGILLSTCEPPGGLAGADQVEHPGSSTGAVSPLLDGL